MSSSFSERKLKNISGMYEILKRNCSADNNDETALIFKRGASSKTLYDLESYKSVGGIHRIQISSKVTEFIEENEVGDKYYPFVIASIHNHRHSTTFGLRDIVTFLEYDCMEEMYLDSGDYIHHLVKKWCITTPQFGLHKDKKHALMKKLNAIYHRISYDETEYKKDIQRSLTMLGKGKDQEVFLSADNSAHLINEKFWEEAKDIIPAHLTRINKRDLGFSCL